MPGMNSSIKLLAPLVLAIATFSQPTRTFEVASIKPSPPLDVAKLMAGQLRRGMRVNAAQVSLSNMYLVEITCTAFKARTYQISGPVWQDILATGGGRFDIHATLPPGATEEDVPGMLLALLVERFGLKFHPGEGEQPVYALIVGKDGQKMKASPPEKTEAARAQVGTVTDASGATTVRTRGSMGSTQTQIRDGIMHMEADRVSMDRLAELLSDFMDRPVVNMTGLTGNFQISLDIAQSELDNMRRRMGRPPEAAPAEDVASEPGGATVLQSVQKLGLKLDPRKIKITKVVIDRLEKTPTEN